LGGNEPDGVALGLVGLGEALGGDLGVGVDLGFAGDLGVGETFVEEDLGLGDPFGFAGDLGVGEAFDFEAGFGGAKDLDLELAFAWGVDSESEMDEDSEPDESEISDSASEAVSDANEGSISDSVSEVVVAACVRVPFDFALALGLALDLAAFDFTVGVVFGVVSEGAVGAASFPFPLAGV
jgi:hypothetical protein